MNPIWAAAGLAVFASWQGTAAPETLSKAAARPVLDGHFKLLSSARSLHIVEAASIGGQTLRTEHWLQRPNLARSVTVGTDAKGVRQAFRTYMFKDSVYMVDLGAKTYDVLDRQPGSPFLNGFEPFCQAKRPKFTLEDKVRATLFQGKSAYAIETGEQSLPGSMVSVFADRITLVPIGWEYAWRGKTEQTVYTSVKVDEKMDPKEFQWSPPKGFKLRHDMRLPKLPKGGGQGG